MNIVQRQSIIVFFNNIKKIGPIKKIGDVDYVSKDMHYLILYVNKSNVEESLKKIRGFEMARSAYISPRSDLRVDYSQDYSAEEDEQ
ncbi:DUF2129 domain-containing protein [Pediococcus pentosaceus]|uniref:DUF2129 domain-containing protein n=1 Tax=Pediococcus pentosaceus TaxID=1255 RepID=UPI0018A17B66|nr:DUF2129 domain-containing protein [Pediococcus pentosaceus]MBF7137112.1 DUF2129 domain-containing protein [Pediococcus pentosaceus]